MSTLSSSLLASALGQIRYRLALAVIGFGLFTGWLLACAIPLCVYASISDTGGAISEASRLALTGSIFLISAGLTYRCRGWIARKALEEAPPEPVRVWKSGEVANAGLAATRFLVLGLVALFSTAIVTAIVVMVAGFLGYGGYLLLTMVSVPVAILIGATIIALAIIIAAVARNE